MAPLIIYVTGVPGAGKSSVRRELKRRGRCAFGTDEDGLAAFFSDDGREISPHDVVDSAEWRRDHVWRLVSERLAEAVEQSGASRIFVCGSVANEGEVWHRFALVIGLLVDEPTLRARLMSRVGNDWGKSDDELALALSWNRRYATEAETWGLVSVDANLPLEAVVDHVVALADAL